MDAPEIRTGRLLLRAWLPGDAEAVHAACQDPQVQRWTRVPVPYGREHARDYVEQVSPACWAAGTDALFALLDAGTGGLLASIPLRGIDRVDLRAEIGLWVLAAARGRGVGSDGARAVCRWGFRTQALRRVEWLAAVDDLASVACAQRAGFRSEGVLRARLNLRGTQSDAWVGGLVPGDLPLAVR